MNRDEIDVLWNNALSDAVAAGEPFTRYRFAALVAAAEREACAKVCEDLRPSQRAFAERYWDAATHCAEVIRARGQA